MSSTYRKTPFWRASIAPPSASIAASVKVVNAFEPWTAAGTAT